MFFLSKRAAEIATPTSFDDRTGYGFAAKYKPGAESPQLEAGIKTPLTTSLGKVLGNPSADIPGVGPVGFDGDSNLGFEASNSGLRRIVDGVRRPVQAAAHTVKGLAQDGVDAIRDRLPSK
jgi:hypothetical protein